MLASSNQVRGFKPGRSRRIFRAKKILSTPSFGGEVKPSVPCHRSAACKISLNLSGSRNLGENTGHFLAHSSRISRVVADVQAPGVESGNAMANYPQELAEDAVCQSHTGHMTGLWFLPARPLTLTRTE